VWDNTIIFVVFCVFRVAHKFEFKLITNETPSKWRPVEGRLCSETHVFDSICVLSVDCRCKCSGTPHALWRSAAFFWVRDSACMSRKCCAESFYFFESVPLVHAEKLIIVSEKTVFLIIWLRKYQRSYAIPSSVNLEATNLKYLKEFQQSFQRMLRHFPKNGSR
jgi:hypothetical protein